MTAAMAARVLRLVIATVSAAPFERGTGQEPGEGGDDAAHSPRAVIAHSGSSAGRGSDRRNRTPIS